MDIARLLKEQIGREAGRIRLPGPLVEYDEVVSVEEITPLQAMELIAQTWERYSNGRNFYPTKIEKIKQYAQLMSDGQWEYLPDGQTIDITDGVVTGGRHRLHAVLLSHTNQKFRIKRRIKKD
jgi:hypothetical protein